MPMIGVKVSGTREYKLLTLLMDYAADNKAQVQCSSIYNKLQEEHGFDSPETEKVLIGIMHDGVAHGNWPWNE